MIASGVEDYAEKDQKEFAEYFTGVVFFCKSLLEGRINLKR